MNPLCVNGTIENLNYISLYDETIISKIDDHTKVGSYEYDIQLADSTNLITSKRKHNGGVKNEIKNGLDEKYHCVMANLPWGINAAAWSLNNNNDSNDDCNVENNNSNNNDDKSMNEIYNDILGNVRNVTYPSSPCFFIAQKSELLEQSLSFHNFHIMKKISIPPTNFSLPKSKKKIKGKKATMNHHDDETGRSSDCTIFLALTPT